MTNIKSEWFAPEFKLDPTAEAATGVGGGHTRFQNTAD